MKKKEDTIKRYQISMNDAFCPLSTLFPSLFSSSSFYIRSVSSLLCGVEEKEEERKKEKSIRRSPRFGCDSVDESRAFDSIIVAISREHTV